MQIYANVTSAGPWIVCTIYPLVCLQSCSSFQELHWHLDSPAAAAAAYLIIPQEVWQHTASLCSVAAMMHPMWGWCWSEWQFCVILPPSRVECVQTCKSVNLVTHFCQLYWSVLDYMIPLPLCHSPLELETKVLKHFTIMEKAPTKAFSWLKAPTNTYYIFITLRRQLNFTFTSCVYTPFTIVS